MKCRPSPCRAPQTPSLPARGAWIEIIVQLPTMPAIMRRSPHGERGLKCRPSPCRAPQTPRRSPHGERGLK